MIANASRYRSGPPPHIGWWEVADGWWSLYDGKRWSLEIYESATPETVASWSAIKVKTMRRWSDYWPQNARVPRVKP